MTRSLSTAALTAFVIFTSCVPVTATENTNGVKLYPADPKTLALLHEMGITLKRPLSSVDSLVISLPNGKTLTAKPDEVANVSVFKIESWWAEFIGVHLDYLDKTSKHCFIERVSMHVSDLACTDRVTR